MPSQAHFGSVLRGRDLFLCHSGVNKPWVENLAERVESVPYLDRHLGVVFDKWDFIKGKNIVTEIDEHIDHCRFIGSDAAMMFNNLALAYFAESRYTEAEPLYQRALAIQEKTLGKGHPDTASTLFHYSELLHKLQRKAEARRLANRARQIIAQTSRERSMQYTINYQDMQH